MKNVILTIAVAAAVLASTGEARGQVGQGGQGVQGRAGGVTPDAGAVTPIELQRMFDAYALVQAQEFLKVSDEQYGRFLPRFKALQDARRQTLQQRTRVLNAVRRLLQTDSPSDDGMLRDSLKQLQDIDARGEADALKAYEAIDQVLDLRQQAKFRVFEEQMERRKLELVTRARQANRLNRQQQQKLP